MSEQDFDHIVYSKNVIEFVTIVNEFCSFVEMVDEVERKEFIVRLQKLLPLLYLKASLIPEIENELDDVPEKFVEEDDYNFLHRKLLSKFGEFDAYLEVFDPEMQYSEAPVNGSLAENIADIYQDLKDFILAFRIGTVEVMNDSLLECRTNFEQYWGQRLVNGLRAIHQLVYGDADLEKEDQKLPTVKNEEGEEGNSPDWILRQHFKNYKGE